MRPRIGIPAGRADGSADAAFRLGADYVLAIEAAGGLPVVLPAGEGTGRPEEALRGVDGLLLAGGGDIAPDLYGEAPHPQLGWVDPDRDRWELALARRALAAGLPVLGVCRGIQVLNVADGGTLYQDLPSQLPEALQHQQKAPRWHRSHPVRVEAESLLARLVGAGELAVNSFHHQAVREVAPGWRVSAAAPDGVVEAMERPDLPFALGIQFHAENLFTRDRRFLRIFEGLVEAAAARGRHAEAAVLAEVWRGEGVESLHRGHGAVVSAGGELLYELGEPAFASSMRSAAKPFQAMVVLESGAGDEFAISDLELAVIAGSHGGLRSQVALVEGLLGRLHLDRSALVCGPRPPLDAGARRELALAGESPSELHHTCSGKHAGMLAAALALGAPASGYAEADHPVQRRARRLLAEVAGVEEARLGAGVDGCGVPTWYLPLERMAYAYARLARPQELPEAHRASAARVARAMLTHPEMVAGPGEFDTALIQASEGRILSKTGAEGLLCLAIPERGWGMALKEEDGERRALYPAALALLEQLDLLGGRALRELERWRHPVLRDSRGKPLSEVRPVPRWTPSARSLEG
ncbi:MAG: asparaginase [Bacillota bacterium]|nr:asparaginase [Bacillota bacterium]